jgi:broad specificity phosphatase PhoE
MMLRYLTHPQVRIDPSVPVPDWNLSELGSARVDAFARRRVLSGTTMIVTSAETKAVETAAPIALELGLEPVVRHDMHENDRSATGFLPPPEFETVADLFFAHPEKSIRGWERAVDAQARIVRETVATLAGHRGGDIVFVGHGGVGTLLLCDFAGLPIARVHDQPSGGGNLFAYDLSTRMIVHGWVPMETVEAQP